MPLSWTAIDAERHQLRGRTDRLSLTFRAPSLDITLGRQAISFGTGRIFTPFDLVAPFSPAVLDSQYKPGIDALRVDGYIGMSGQHQRGGRLLWARARGRWGLEELVLAGHGGFTVGVFDLTFLAGGLPARPGAGLRLRGRHRPGGSAPRADPDHPARRGCPLCARWWART